MLSSFQKKRFHSELNSYAEEECNKKIGTEVEENLFLFIEKYELSKSFSTSLLILEPQLLPIDPGREKYSRLILKLEVC